MKIHKSIPVVAMVITALSSCAPGQLFGPTFTPTFTYTNTYTITPSLTNTLTNTPTNTPSPTPLQGVDFYLLDDYTLSQTPPDYPQSYFWCNNCESSDVLVRSWSIKLKEPVKGNYYRYSIVDFGGTINIRLYYKHNGKDNLVVEWNSISAKTDEKDGLFMDASIGDTIMVEIDISGKNEFWIENFKSYSFFTVINK